MDKAPRRGWAFGPGAVIASLTIGAGELIFSARAGSLFGYRLLWFFVCVLFLKWALVFATGRHMVLTGAHPFERWRHLPGPRGWLPWTLLVLGAAAFPVWVAFHAGTLGTLLAALTGTENAALGSAHLLWALGVLLAAVGLTAAGSYALLERVQLTVVGVMLLAVVAALILVQPDWTELFRGLFWPSWPVYPAWAGSEPELASRPVWLEAITYVGVIGGSGYDYLAYVSYLRDKEWGRARRPGAPRSEDGTAADSVWIRTVAADCILSFAAVLLFTVVFVACGAAILGPQHKVPAGTQLLTFQAEFVSVLHPAIRPLYYAGALLAIGGTLYGTIAIAPALLREFAYATEDSPAQVDEARLRRRAIAWVGAGGAAVLVWIGAGTWFGSATASRTLVKILTPANLFTGVFLCGVVALFSVWNDRRHLPPGRQSRFLAWANVLGGSVFLLLGAKGYWDHSRGYSAVLFLATVAAGWAVASWRSRQRPGA